MLFFTFFFHLVRQEIGPIATPEIILNVRSLPKTRSDKIMRRVLALVAKGERKNFGDLSTIADEAILDHLIKVRAAYRPVTATLSSSKPTPTSTTTTATTTAAAAPATTISSINDKNQSSIQ